MDTQSAIHTGATNQATQFFPYYSYYYYYFYLMAIWQVNLDQPIPP